MSRRIVVAMDVFVIPMAIDRYELYCETSSDVDTRSSGVDTGSSDVDTGWHSPPDGLIKRWRHRFAALLKRWRHRFTALLEAVEHRQRHPDAEEPEGWLGRAQDRMMAWVVERIAEQRLLWNLRGLTTAVAAHPQDLTFDQVMTLVRGMLQRDYERHRRWLIIDAVGMVVSWPLVVVPGPNVLLYYFMLRVGGHWFSMRGARQGLDRVAWTGRPCPPLSELRGVGAMEPAARARRILDIGARLRLEHLSTFFERVAVRHA